MGRFSAAAKVGLFSVVLLFAGFFVYRFVSKSAQTENGYRIFALMRDASGVAKHSQVRIAGIPVGNIEGIRLEQGKARIDMRVQGTIALYEDATLAKVATSLLGEYYLSISPGTEGKRKLVDGDPINLVLDTSSTDDIMKQVADITRDVKRVSEALASTIGTDQGREDLRDTLKNLAEVTIALNQTVRENRESVRHILLNLEQITQRGRPEIEHILENVRETTNDVRALMAQNDKGKDGEIRQIIEKVNRASDSLESSLKNVETVTSRIERGEGTLGRLSKDDKFINEAENVTEGLGDFIGGISRLQTIVALRSDYQFLSSTIKSYVELRLQPREDKYYLIEVINDPHGLTRFEQIDVDSTNPNDPPHYREVRNVTTNSVRFSLQFAQMIGPFTGRFGIKESTGGVGLDLHLLDNRFELRQDLFGFGEVVIPRWRVSLGYQFVHRLWLLAGVDDIINPTRRDYFIGAQLRFNDLDLKSILPFAKAP